jgi:hypothetical protein
MLEGGQVPQNATQPSARQEMRAANFQTETARKSLWLQNPDFKPALGMT